MGLFSSKKRIFVSSVVYNLAGDEKDRANYMKTTVTGAVLSAQDIGPTVVRSYLQGPGMRFRQFGKWARTSGYTNAIGMTANGTIRLGHTIDPAVVAAQIPVTDPKYTVMLQSTDIGGADFTKWANQYQLKNHPDLYDTAWTADLDVIGGNQIILRQESGVVETFFPAGYDINGRYLYATYTETAGRESGPLVPGDPVTLPPDGFFPSTFGWTQNSYSSVSKDMTLTTQVHKDITYSDNRTPETSDTSSNTTRTYTEMHGVWEKTDYQGSSGNQITEKRRVMAQDQTGTKKSTVTTNTTTETIAGGVVKTTKTTTTTDTFEYLKIYKVDTQTNVLQSWGPTRIFIYQHGTGNAALDAMFIAGTNLGAFFPHIPFRIDNRFLDNTYYKELRALSVKAFKKATTSSYDNIQKSIADNPSIGDIDYAYAVFGVSLNVKEVACRRYIYEFFQEFVLSTGEDASSYRQWQTEWQAAHESMQNWVYWKTAEFNNDTGTPLPEPEVIPYPPPPSFNVTIDSQNLAPMNYNMEISGFGMEETTFSGLGRAGAKKNDLWFETMTDTKPYKQIVLRANGGDDTGSSNVEEAAYTVDHVRLIWQYETNAYRVLDLYGLLHRNYIYGGNWVEITAKDALADADESGFIIPLHEGIYHNLPITVATQMATACAFMVFNCYQVVKTKWYQSSIFRIILVIIIIVVAVYTGYVSGETTGLLGTNAAVGAGLGFTGTAAIVAGAVANAIAAMVVMQVITAGATSLFGDKLGSVIGTIASMVAIAYGSGQFSTGQTMSSMYGDMMKADNLLKLTSAVGGAVSNYIQAAAKGVAAETQQVLEDYDTRSKEISDLWDQNLGTETMGVIDPMMFTDAGKFTADFQETRDTFLQRTLMTGSDIAQLSMDMIGKFVSATTNTDLPTRG